MICFILTGLLASLPAAALGGHHSGDSQPNIILINLDDADFDLLSPVNIDKRFPCMQQLVTQGLYFSNLHVSTPICGPSRACLFRGQYAHRTNIRINDPDNPNSSGFTGGMPSYVRHGLIDEDLSVWIKRAGYRTMLVGKYLNGKIVRGIPPGWDDYCNSLGASYYNTLQYTNLENPRGSFKQLAPGVYRTAAETDDAVALIQTHLDSGSDSPFFLYLAPLAPHQPAANATGGAAETPYSRWWTQAVVPFAPDIREKDFSDKSNLINWLKPFNAHRSHYADQVYRDRLRSTRSVDDMFGAIMEQLETNDLLDNTYVLLTSDNGFHLGHQRLMGKGHGYDRSTRVPLYVMGPGVPAGHQANHLLAHVDITATLLDLTQAAPTVAQDGKSFRQLLNDPSSADPAQWRSPVLIQNWESRTLQGNGGRTVAFASTGLRLYDAIYTEWADGTPEYYDLTSDPYQLENRYETLADLEKQALETLLRQSKSEMLPVTSISMPLRHNQLVSDQFTVTGLAEDNLGVTDVRLTIRDVQSKQYWNGEDWIDERFNVQAELKRPGQQISTWQYNHLPPSENELRKVAVWARAYAEGKQYDLHPAVRRLRIQPARPMGEILFPLSGQMVSGSVVIRGERGAAHGINDVQLVIVKLKDRMYWDGSEWTSQWSAVTPDIQDQVWEYKADLDEGDYFISSRLRNSHFVQQPPATSRFTVAHQ